MSRHEKKLKVSSDNGKAAPLLLLVAVVLAAAWGVTKFRTDLIRYWRIRQM